MNKEGRASMNPVGETEDYMEEENKQAIAHENLRRAIEVPSIAIKNLKQAEKADEATVTALKEVIVESAKKLKELISK